MIYLKNPLTDEIISGENFGSFFDDWEELTNQEVNDYQVQKIKNEKINQLNQNRNAFCLIPVEYNGNTYATTPEAKIAITYMITSLSTLATEAQYPNYPQGENITLTKADFKAIALLMQTREMESRNKRKNLLDQINSISSDQEYFDQSDNLITALQALESININFQ